MINRAWVLPLLMVFLLLACNKNEPKSLLEIKRDYLIGTGSTLNSWKLKGLTIDSIPQVLSGSQVNYIKKYLSTNNFTDTDGASGNWSLPVVDSLKEVFNNYPSGIIVQQTISTLNISKEILAL